MSMIHDPVCLRRPVLHRACPMAGAARLAMDYSLRRVGAAAQLPGGRRLGTPGVAPNIEIVDPDAAFERMGHQPNLGVGESYMAGDWRAAPGVDLAAAMLPFAERLVAREPAPVKVVRKVVNRALPGETRNTLRQARRNIEAHYDLGNDMFESFLDDTLTYSSARFDAATPRHAQSLEDAQTRKIELALDRAGVADGSRILEIGTGWGTLAILAARRGAEVTSITISPSQAALARERIAAAGLSERVSVELRDYREQQGRFDAVVSIEMIEAVGEEFWPGYFQAIDRALVPGGRGVIQAILMTEERFEATRNSYGWIQKHIFPGGIIPSVGALQRAADPSGLRITPVDMFGHDYAETLRRWRSRFLENWPMVRDMGFDDVFQRRWEFYLAYCEAGFDAAAIDVGQLVLERVGSLRADAARAEALAG